MHRGDVLRRPRLLLGRQRGAERGVRDDERADQLGGQRPLRGIEAAGHQPGESGPGLRDVGVAQLGAKQRVEDARRLRADDRPVARLERDERVARPRC